MVQSEYRLIVWKNCLEMLKEKPLQGFGAGNFKIFYPAFSHAAEIDLVAQDTKKHLGRAHNDYLQVAVELGLPGLFFFVLLISYGIMQSWRLLAYT